MQAIIIPPVTDLPVGICVKTECRYYRGSLHYVASHQRDSETKWQVRIPAPHSSTDGHDAALIKWMEQFTDKPSSTGYLSKIKVVARGGDQTGYYYTLTVNDDND